LVAAAPASAIDLSCARPCCLPSTALPAEALTARQGREPIVVVERGERAAILREIALPLGELLWLVVETGRRPS
jgi:hypothetical protein